MKSKAKAAELREFPRVSLVMRTAKLISRSSEYFCIVRDVSATGAKLRFFHEPPADEFVMLELANGEHYAMQQVWSENDQSGYRFAAPIDVDEFIEERSDYPRRPLRLSMERHVLLTAEGRDHHCRLVNISQQGACIDAQIELPVRMEVRIEVDGLPVRFGHTCWRRKKTLGVAFQQAFRLDELARLVHALQPAGTPGNDSSTEADGVTRANVARRA